MKYMVFKIFCKDFKITISLFLLHIFTEQRLKFCFGTDFNYSTLVFNNVYMPVMSICYHELNHHLYVYLFSHFV